MALYLSIIAVGSILLYALDIIFAMPVMGFTPGYLAIAISMSVAYQFAVDAIAAFVICRLPNKWFSKDKKIFNVSKKEQKLYEFFGIRKWKDKVWELGKLNGFSKSSIDKPNDPIYIERFFIETNKGVAEHIASILLGFTVIVCFPIKYVWIITFPIAMINLLLNTMSTMILRYNYPKLKTLYKRATRNLEFKQKEGTK